MSPILKFHTPLVQRNASGENASRRAEVEVEVEEDNYVFPEVITLNQEAFDDFANHVKNPRPPTPELVAVFKR